MRFLFINIFFCFCFISAFAQVSIDGRTMAYDSRTKSYLCSVPETWFNDGSVKAFTCDTADVQFTFLPIVRLYGKFGYEYAEGTVDVIMPDMTNQESLRAKVKWRGATTNGLDKNKRNYHLKFLDINGKKKDRKFFGLRSDNSWLLDAAQVDMSRVRNRVATDLWNDFATKPYYFDKEPKALTGTRGQFVEVFLNDEYRGIYCMTENIDRSQMKLKKYEDNANGTVTIHGQLWKAKGFTHCNFSNYSDYDNTSETWGDFETKYPELEDVNPTDYSIIYDAVHFIRECEAEDFFRDREQYIDWPVFYDYYLFCVMLNAIDNHNGKNIFWACYDAQESRMITPAVWDLDCTVGGYFNPAVTDEPKTFPDHSPRDIALGFNITWQFFLFNDTEFFDKIAARYLELRKGPFATNALKNRYHKYMDMLSRSGAYEREKIRWSGDTDLAGRELNFEEEAKAIDTWINKRAAYLDRTMLTLGVNNVEVSNNNDEHTYNLQGISMGKTTTLPKGVYIKEGRKFIVK